MVGWIGNTEKNGLQYKPKTAFLIVNDFFDSPVWLGQWAVSDQTKLGHCCGEVTDGVGKWV